MKIAIVTPWFGEQLQGGAERIAWQAAHGLASRGHALEVLTTCSSNFSNDWSRNDHPAGTEITNGLTVRRFIVRPRQAERFDRVNQKLVALTPSALKRGVNPVSDEESETFVEENIQSDDLIAHLAQSGSGYDAVLFLPYLYGPILKGWSVVADRAFLQPCLHDESYAYLPQVAAMMRGVRGLLFNSSGEQEIAQHLYGPGIVARGTIVGSAIELETAVSMKRISINGATPEAAPFVLYLGRRADTKNVSFLVRAFRGYRLTFPNSTLQLVLAGPGAVNYGDKSAGILDLGFITEERKVGLLLAARALLQPSKNESYSRTMMEAWLWGRPVAVHGECLATSRAVDTTGAGWTASAEEDWVRVLALIEGADEASLSEIGSRAAAYVQRFASWDGVVQNYEEVFDASHPPAGTWNQEPPVHQILDMIEYGDMLALQGIAIRRALLEAGYDSRIFSRRVDPRMQHLAFPGDVPSDSPLIVHAHRSADAAIAFAENPQRKILLLHGTEPIVIGHVRRVAQKYDGVFATSPAVGAMLGEELGIGVQEYLPIADPLRWNIPPDTTLMSALQDGKTNILSVHGIEPKNGQRELLQTFAHYLSMDLNARLILAGRFDFEDPYYQELLRLVHGSALSQHVLITGPVSEPALAALYATAHVYCSLSERDHLGTTLVDAMWFDVPVVAFSAPTVRAILADAGIILRDKHDLVTLAALLKIVANDAETRSAVLFAQQRRRIIFGPDGIRRQTRALLTSLDLEIVAGLT